MRDRRTTGERAKRSGIKIEKNWAENGALGTPQVRGDEGEMCGGRDGLRQMCGVKDMK